MKTAPLIRMRKQLEIILNPEIFQLRGYVLNGCQKGSEPLIFVLLMPKGFHASVK